jgi:carbonic anhydrase
VKQFHIMTGLAFALPWAGLLPGQRDPDAALEVLGAGNRRFVQEQSSVPPLNEGLRRSLARAQSPLAIVVCCSDSQVPPEHVFNCGLGELFVVRVAGPCIDPEVIASIEYAAEHLGLQLCVVLSHESCSAIKACAEQAAPDAHGLLPAAGSQAMQALLERLEPAVRKARALDLGGSDLLATAEEEQAQLGTAECLRRSPVLRFLQRQGHFRIVAARQHLLSGEVEWLPERPQPLAEPGDPAVPPATAPANMPPHTALRLLQAGHRRFLSTQRPAGDVSAARREALTHGQQPFAIVVACADSRTSPEILFDAGLGDLFVVRVCGNVLNDDVLASIEHAALRTGAPLCVVLGHTACGAVAAAAKQPPDQHLSLSMRALLARLEPSVERARAQAHGDEPLIDLAVRFNVQRFVQETRNRSADLRRLEQAGRFALVPTVYDLESGDLQWLDDAPAQVPPAAPAAETAPRRNPPRSERDADADAKVAAEPQSHTPLRGEHTPPRAREPSSSPSDLEQMLARIDPKVVAAGFGILTLLIAGLMLIRRRS